MFFYAYFGTIAAMFIFKFLNQKSKISSTCKYTFDSRFPVFLLWITIVFNDNIPSDKTNQNMLVLAMGYVFVFLISTVYLGFKHYQFQKKFAIQ